LASPASDLQIAGFRFSAGTLARPTDPIRFNLCHGSRGPFEILLFNDAFVRVVEVSDAVLKISAFGRQSTEPMV
jgi:hypothetical protein